MEMSQSYLGLFLEPQADSFKPQAREEGEAKYQGLEAFGWSLEA